MKAKIEVKIRPFAVPNFVTCEPGEEGKGGDGPSYAISMLDAETLDQMCNEFRDAVFKKAGKQQPARCALER